MSKVLRQDVRLTVAGRTDAGVHATGQVAHCDLLPTANSAPGDQRAPGAPSDPSAPGDQRAPGGQSAHDNLRARLARALPPDVRLTSVTPAPPAFDARFSALRRHYVYRVCDTPWAASPLRRRDTVTWPRPLDLAALDQAAEGLLGEHDFVAFCRRREGATTIRELQRLTWTRDADGVLNAHVTADAFCHSMVRSLVGALIAVGEGRRPPEWPRTLLSAPTRSSEVTVAPAHGLTLVQVDYPPDDQLATRATLTRNLRTTP